MEQTAPIERVAAYVDGFNFYHGLMARGWSRYRWLDYVALVERFLIEGRQLVSTRYFTSRMTHQPESLRRQDTYIRALLARGGIDVVSGEFETRQVKCGVCGVWYKRPQEKKTDVNIATHLVADALENRFDRAYLLCADADLEPAVKFVVDRCGKSLTLIDPPRRHSSDLAALADAHLHVNVSLLRQCQLPNPVVFQNRRGKVRRIHRPEKWA